MLDHVESYRRFPTKEPFRAYASTLHHRAHLGTVPRSATKRKADHPLGWHKPRIPDKVIFGKLLQILIFGCAYEVGMPDN